MSEKSASPYTKTIVVWCGAIISCFLWGSAFPVIKLGYGAFKIESGEMATQILFAGVRFLCAGLLTILIGSLIQRRFILPQRRSWFRIFKLSLLQTVAQYVLFYIGLAHTTGVRASIVEGTNVFVAILVASLIFSQEGLSFQKMIGCIIGFAGVVLVNLSGGGTEGGSFLSGDLLIVMSTVAYAFSSVLLKEYSRDEDPVVLSGYQFVMGGAVMIAVGWLMGGRLLNVTGQGMGYLIYLAFVSAGAYSLWGILMKHNPVSRVAVFGFMTPIFGVLTSLILLNEGASLGFVHLISLILVCVGIFVVNSGSMSK